MIPEENQKDLVEIPDNIKGKLDIRPVRWIDEVLQVALTRQPTPLPTAPGQDAPRAAAPKPARRSRGRGHKQVQAH
jgi:ATP-dependent Lon protease